MAQLTDKQRCKIFALKGERGLDDDTLRGYIDSLVGKSSIKELTVAEAIKVIDALQGKKQNAPDRLSYAQRSYIEGMAKDLGWKGEDGEVDMKKLGPWLENRYGITLITSLTPKKASDAIEGLKAMTKRKQSVV